MIKLLKKGVYSLVETKSHNKMLVLDRKDTYAWVDAEGIGEILVASHNAYKRDNILAVGRYRMYRVKNEAKFTDLIHLELHAGNGIWQGYLLTTGLPANEKKRSRIIPTDEIITSPIL